MYKKIRENCEMLVCVDVCVRILQNANGKHESRITNDRRKECQKN